MAGRTKKTPPTNNLNDGSKVAAPDLTQINQAQISQAQISQAQLDPANEKPVLFGAMPVYEAPALPSRERDSSLDPSREEAAKTIGEVSEKLGFAPTQETLESLGSLPYQQAVETAKEAQSEVERLRKLLADQQKAAVEALQTALASEKRLAENKAEAEKRRDLLAVEPGIRRSPASSQEAGLVRATLERTQKDLERERAARAVEAERNSHKITVLEKQLVVATNIVESIQKVRSRKLKIRIAAAAAVVVVGACLGVFAFLRFAHSNGSSSVASHRQERGGESEQQIETLVQAPVTGNAVATGSWGSSSELNVPGSDVRSTKPQTGRQPDVTSSVSRLSQALGKFQGQDPEVVLKAVNRKSEAVGRGTVCSFEWRNGQPALVLSGPNGSTSLPSMVGLLNNCAAAVESYR